MQETNIIVLFTCEQLVFSSIVLVRSSQNNWKINKPTFDLSSIRGTHLSGNIDISETYMSS